MSPAELEKARWRPAGAIAIKPKDADCVAYWSQGKDGRVYIVAYRGRAVRHCAHYGFRTVAKAQEWVDGFAESVRNAAKRRVQAAAERKAYRHELQVGDVLVSSWGYDQTNIDYYQVTRRSASSVWVREIRAMSKETGSMVGECVPAPDSFCGPEKLCRVRAGGWVRIDSVSSAHKIEPRIVGGVKVFPVDRWSAYA